MRVKPLPIVQPLPPDQMRKLITINRPEHNLVSCQLCMSDKEIRIIESPGTGERFMFCKPCLTDLAKRNIS